MIYSHEVEMMCPVAQGANHGPAPVSYTHLDVYKRQVWFFRLRQRNHHAGTSEKV